MINCIEQRNKKSYKSNNKFRITLEYSIILPVIKWFPLPWPRQVIDSASRTKTVKTKIRGNLFAAIVDFCVGKMLMEPQSIITPDHQEWHY